MKKRVHGKRGFVGTAWALDGWCVCTMMDQAVLFQDISALHSSVLSNFSKNFFSKLKKNLIFRNAAWQERARKESVIL